MKKVRLFLLLISFLTALSFSTGAESELTCSIGISPCSGNFTILKLEHALSPTSGYYFYNATEPPLELPDTYDAYLCCRSDYPWDTLTPGLLRTSDTYAAAFKDPLDAIFPPRYIDAVDIPLSTHQLALGSNVKMVECTNVLYDDDPATDECEGYETCLLAFRYGSMENPVLGDEYGLIYDCNLPKERQEDMKICCSLTTNYDDPEDLKTAIYKAEVISYYDATKPDCSAGDPTKCEVGEYLQTKIHWTTTFYQDTITIRLESDASHPDCSISETGIIHGIRTTCTIPEGDCYGSFLITNIPTGCENAPMHATIAIAFSNSFTQDATGSFTFGTQPPPDSRRLEVESKIFSGPGFSTPPAPPANWEQAGYTGTISCIEGRTAYATTLGLNPANQLEPYFETGASWPARFGGCELDSGDSITKNLQTLVPSDPLPSPGVYYITIMGIFGPDNENQEEIDVEVTMGATTKNYIITDMFNETNANLQTLTTTTGAKYTYGGCTIPEQLPLTASSTIKVTAPDNTFYYDYLNISTEPNPHGLPNCTNTEMRCANITDREGVIIGGTCEVTRPWPQRGMCENPTDYCVYGNEDGSGTPHCYEYLERANNSEGLEIECQMTGIGELVWCPKGFEWDDIKSACLPGDTICDSGRDQQTASRCQDIPGSGRPGFMNNVVECLNDFNNQPPEGPPNDGPEWNYACCPFFKVRVAADDYYFFNKQPAKIY
jgi:hypothetical protein